MTPRDALRAFAGYVRKNPDPLASLTRVASDARKLRFGIPIRALRWAATQGGERGAMPKKKGGPTDIELSPTPPAMHLSASVDAMGTPIRVSGAVRIEEVYLGPDAVRIAVRVNGLTLALLDPDVESQVAMAIKSGMLDLSKIGNVVKFLPKRPPFIIDAGGDRIVVDLLKIPSLAANQRFRRALEVISPIVGIRALETDGEYLYVTLRATPSGLREAVKAARQR